MPFPRLLAVLFTLATFPAFALTPTDMEMDESGNIQIHADNLADMTLTFALIDTSEGVWEGASEVPKFAPEAGPEIQREGEYGFPDGSKVNHKLAAKIVERDLKVNVDWPTTSPAKGFGMAKLRIPQEAAEDITIFANESEIVKNFVRSANLPPHVDEMVFRRTSTGEFLFKVSGEELVFDVIPLEPRENGIEFRIAKASSLETVISEFTNISFTISFKE